MLSSSLGNRIQMVTGLDPQKLSSLHTLELRGNQLKSTMGINLPKLKNLYLVAAWGIVGRWGQGKGLLPGSRGVDSASHSLIPVMTGVTAEPFQTLGQAQQERTPHAAGLLTLLRGLDRCENGP